MVYLIGKALVVGTDINVYLYASQQFFKGQNIYSDNPYNFYLYSPLFAALLGLISWMDWQAARVIWLLFNVLLAYRSWVLLGLTFSAWPKLRPRFQSAYAWMLLLVSFGFLNHNFNLGQISVLILWLSLEATWRVQRGQPIRGAALLALGINIKILPLLVGYYWLAKGRVRASVYAGLFTALTLLLPAMLIGWQGNLALHEQWLTRIMPGGDNYVYETTNGCQSLNCLLAAYFYDFPEAELSASYEAARKIARISEPTLSLMLQGSRIALALSILGLVVYSHRRRLPADRVLLWELAYVCLVTLLVFPHQMKYAMLYFVPAGAYVIRYYLTLLSSGEKLRAPEATLGLFSALLMLVLALMGRDIVGDQIVNTLDYYHYMGLVNVLFLGVLWACRPDRFIAE